MATVLLVGCGMDDIGAADRLAYSRAAAGDHNACAEVADSQFAAECAAFSAASIAPDDLAAAHAQCAAIPAGLWRDECGFLVCDAATVSVADARHCCADAGRYRNRCLGHAVTREVMAAVAKFELGEEDKAWKAAQEASVRALGPPGNDRAEAVMSRLLADRAGPGGLTTAVCGTAPDAICSAVYSELVVRAASAQGKDSRALVRPACARSVSLDRATGQGLPGWHASLDRPVQAAFSRMCRR